MAGETTTSVDRSTSDGMLGRLRKALEGPNTLGQGRPFWLGFTVLVALLLVYPMFRSSYYVSNTAYLLVSAFLGLSLCIVWGYTGIFSFGQVAFYGIAGYTFGIVSINVTGPAGTMAGLLVGIAVSGAFAFLVGYFMFYGGVSDVYVAIITLAVTLVLNTFMGQTAGEEWAVGAARLGGFNGMTEIPSLALGVGDAAVEITDLAFYYFVVGALLLTYLGLRVLVNSDIGYVMVGIRENQDRRTVRLRHPEDETRRVHLRRRPRRLRRRRLRLVGQLHRSERLRVDLRGPAHHLGGDRWSEVAERRHRRHLRRHVHLAEVVGVRRPVLAGHPRRLAPVRHPHPAGGIRSAVGEKAPGATRPHWRW